MSQPLIRLSAGVIGYAGIPAVSGVDLELHRSEVIAVLGANGSGKSTLVKGILGLADLMSGVLELFGEPASAFRDRARIGYVPQRHTVGGIVPSNVDEVVASGRLGRQRRFRRATASDRHAVAHAIEVVGLTGFERRPITELSGGQQRRVLIARALAGEPEVLVMDEPLAGVDLANQGYLASTLKHLVTHEGTTILLVAHELGPVQSLVTRGVVMRDGSVEYDGPLDEPHRRWTIHDPHPHSPDRQVEGLGLSG
ncbi:MAG: metal ABC transporter ATP-binding protein [Candidatus Nanopelagicales bacterium]